MKFWLRRFLVLFLLLMVVVGGIWAVSNLRGASKELLFRAGLHDAVTGEELESVFDAAESDTVIMVVNFWASWCGPCDAEAPGLQKAHRYYQASYGTKVILVGLNVGESDKTVKDFAKKHKITFPLIGGVSTAQYSEGLPTTVVYRKREEGWERVTDRSGALPYQMLADTVDVLYADILSGE